jgi:hypothetical protein
LSPYVSRAGLSSRIRQLKVRIEGLRFSVTGVRLFSVYFESEGVLGATSDCGVSGTMFGCLPRDSFSGVRRAKCLGSVGEGGEDDGGVDGCGIMIGL